MGDDENRRAGRKAANVESSTGRRLNDARIEEIYADVLDLLSEVGYDNMTVDAIAARSRIGKNTLYRQWQGKSGLVAEALRHDNPAPASIDTGSLRGDLMAITHILGNVAPADGPLLAALSHASMVDPDLGDALRRRLFAPFGDVIGESLDRAVARGEIIFDAPALKYVPLAFMAMMPGRSLFEGIHVTPEYLAGFVDHVLLPSLTAGRSAI